MQERYPAEHFDRFAGSYDHAMVSAGGFPFTGYTGVLDRVVERADTHPGMQILDLGVGTGNLAERFADLGCTVRGIDFSAGMLQIARRKVPEAVFVQADLLGEWPPRIRHRYDRVISSYSLHHFDPETRCLLLSRILREYLSPNGWIVVGDVSFPSADVREAARTAIGPAWDTSEFPWAADETVARCAAAGVRVGYEQVSSCGGVYTFTLE